MEKGLEKIIKKLFNKILEQDNIDIKEFSPLTLAYIGDAVHEIFIRTHIASGEKIPVNKLHRLSIDYVKANAQFIAVNKIKEILTEEELDIVRRGRNAKSGTVPKNADVTKYKYATGFETLLGFLFLTGKIERLMDILNITIEKD